MRITVQVDARATLRGLESARRRLEGDAADVCERAARQRILPRAKREAPKKAAPYLVITGTPTGCRLEANARGMTLRMIGYMNDGGTIRTQIVPKGKRALKLDGRFAAVVKNPRSFRGLHFMEKAVQAELPSLRRDLERRLPDRIQRRIDA